LRPADPGLRLLKNYFQAIFVFYQDGVLERPSNIPLERFVEEIKFYGLQKEAIGDDNGIFCFFLKKKYFFYQKMLIFLCMRVFFLILSAF